MIQRKTRILLIELALVLILVFIALALKPSTENYWLYASSAVIPHGSTTRSFVDYPNIKLLSVQGERWTSENKRTRAKAYSALVILPKVSLRENGSVSTGDGRTQTDTLKWLRENSLANDYQNTEERNLTITYDAIFQTMRIDSESYSLAAGNLFVIRFDEKWQPQVTQLNTTVSEDDEFEAREYFKRAVPNEEALQKYF
jgi:hypothetical protein